MTAPVIAIDGPAGSGKSTLARALAKVLGFAYVNTGLMYRALTARAIERNIHPADAAGLAELASEVRFGLSNGRPPEVLVDGSPPGADVVSEAVEALVSQVSAHPGVRESMRAEQRRLGMRGAVMEGRDIATVVFPDAALKLFLTANPEERAARRIAERGGNGAAAAELAARDASDERVNPFVPAPEAVVIDSSGRTAEDVLAEALALARTRLGGV